MITGKYQSFLFGVRRQQCSLDTPLGRSNVKPFTEVLQSLISFRQCNEVVFFMLPHRHQITVFQFKAMTAEDVKDSFCFMNFISLAGSAHNGACLAEIWQLWEVWTGHWGQPPHQESYLAQCQEIHGERRLLGGGKKKGMIKATLCFKLHTLMIM